MEIASSVTIDRRLAKKLLFALDSITRPTGKNDVDLEVTITFFEHTIMIESEDVATIIKLDY